MKKILTLLALTIAILAMVITPSLVTAQDDETTSAVRPIKDGLAIVAPRAAAVGQNISMTVFQCSEQTPVTGAGVWALTPEKIESVKTQISENTDVIDEQCENILNANGTFLGRTNESGKIWHSFDDNGRYLLVTFKAQYWPDWRMIVVGSPSSSLSRLVIDAPNRAEVGEKITIIVSDKNSQEPVKDAGVWAVTREIAESIKDEIAAVKASEDKSTIAAQIENLLNTHCLFLGTTNGAGKLEYTFETAGGYMMITYKPGYLTGLKPILIGTLPKVLVIDAPFRAKVDEKITIVVTRKNTQDHVKDAGVWAVTREVAESLKDEISAIKASANPSTIQAQIESLLNAHSIFIGTTNGAGKIEYAFENAGRYLLVTYKPGYWPGFRPILVVSNTTQVTTDNSVDTNSNSLS
jgi:vacuolar-type H+-ATPase subunit F/Vma7